MLKTEQNTKTNNICCCDSILNSSMDINSNYKSVVVDDVIFLQWLSVTKYLLSNVFIQQKEMISGQFLIRSMLVCDIIWLSFAYCRLTLISTQKIFKLLPFNKNFKHNLNHLDKLYFKFLIENFGKSLTVQGCNFYAFLKYDNP